MSTNNSESTLREVPMPEIVDDGKMHNYSVCSNGDGNFNHYVDGQKVDTVDEYGNSIEPPEPEPQQGSNDYDPYARRQRIGNNKYKQPKHVAKAKKRMAAQSKKRNHR